MGTFSVPECFYSFRFQMYIKKREKSTHNFQTADYSFAYPWDNFEDPSYTPLSQSF